MAQDPRLVEAQMTAIPKTLKVLRLRLNLGVEAAVKQAAIGGFEISKNSVYGWEKEEKSPGMENWWRYLFALGYERAEISAELELHMAAAEEAARPLVASLEEAMEMVQGRAQNDPMFRRHFEQLIEAMPEGAERAKLEAFIAADPPQSEQEGSE